MNQNNFFQEIMVFIGNMHAYTHALVKDERPDTVTPLQYKILEYIFFSQSVTTSQVSECMNVSLPNASRELKKLFQLQLLEKETCTLDRRKSTIRLSESGQRLMDDTFNKIKTNFWQQVGPLSKGDMADILTSMTTLNDKIFLQQQDSNPKEKTFIKK